eukprot:gb/GFBE01019459.1/.p1 GENE.gb/GFBE01019459.1/~~gb/GFBE01019459.1/.p1  ORF type:complete len:189 (+),score=34.82 gb/GFBE01019459.1/:1-567(+)
MSLDVLLADQHNSHVQLVKKETDLQMMNAVKELGPGGVELLKGGNIKDLTRHILLQSDSARKLLAETFPASSAGTQPKASSLRAAGAESLRRQRKVDQAVQQKVAQETEALRKQIREEAAQRRQLQDELRARRAAENDHRQQASVRVRSCTRFETNPDFQPKPLPPSTKRAVLRVDSLCTGLTYFEMG